MEVWQDMFLSMGGRLVLINSSLSNIPLYMLYLFSAPLVVLKRMDIFQKKIYYGKVKKWPRNTI